MDEYMKKMNEKYEKLREVYPHLPKFEDFVFIFGIPVEEDLKDLPSLFKAVRASLNNLQESIMDLLSPSDFVSAHDGKFVYDRRKELLDILKCVQICKKKLLLALFESEKTLSLEPLAKGIAEVAEVLKKDITTWKKLQKKILEGWKGIETWEDEVNYRW